MAPFHATARTVCGVRLRAPAVVDEAAVEVAAGRLRTLLGRAPAIVANLAAARAELQLVGRDQAVTDLPMYRHLAGVRLAGGRTLDERGRGYGGLFACVGEESLLNLPTARHADHRDVCSHEVAHTVLDFGLDARLRGAVEARHAAALAEGRWAGTYAATNAHEFFAELTMWYVGSRGDYGSLPSPAPGADWLRGHDPESYALLDGLWSGRRSPRPVTWDALVPRSVTRSGRGATPVTVAFVNPTDVPHERRWLDHQGREVSYGPVPAEGAVVQPTWSSHAWVLVGPDGVRRGPYVAGRRPGRVTVTDAP